MRTGTVSASVSVPSEVGWIKSTRNANRAKWTPSCFVLSQEETTVLYYGLILLIVGLIAGALGISGVAAIGSQIGWVLFLIGNVFLVIHLMSGNRPRSVV